MFTIAIAVTFLSAPLLALPLFNQKDAKKNGKKLVINFIQNGIIFKKAKIARWEF